MLTAPRLNSASTPIVDADSALLLQVEFQTASMTQTSVQTVDLSTPPLQGLPTQIALLQ